MGELLFEEDGLQLKLFITGEGDVRLMHFGPPRQEEPVIAPDFVRWFRLVELQSAGENQQDHHGSKYTGTSPGRLLKFFTHRDHCNSLGRKIEIEQAHNGLTVISHLQFYAGLPVVRCWTELVNRGTEAVAVEYVSSFCLTGLELGGPRPRHEKSRLYLPHNTWYGEAQWRCDPLQQLGLSDVRRGFTTKRLSISNTGTWSCDGYLPMGMYENTDTGTTLFWQIENNGSWHWEIGESAEFLYLRVGGPAFNENHWMKKLKPGERFVSVPAAVGRVRGGFDEAVAALTKYRRAIRRPSRDTQTLPIIFNDYMNCLMGDPTTEKLLPLIEAAAEVGCEYFVIDAGWYADGFWWDGVGEWLPSKVRFPGGLKQVLDRIRQRGMTPGLWLEIEVMGIKCPLADQLPKEWFFHRHGKRVIDNGRYQLDFRHPGVRAHADAIVDRLVNEYGAGYIKMDYNINAGPGTDLNADSLGAGLLEHNRAYLAWIDQVFERYPNLVIENCGSGGLRMDYAMLSRHSIQSSTDQTDLHKNAVVVASVLSAVTPEQSAVWSYPLADSSREDVIFNMINALLMRVHQSGKLSDLNPENRNLVKQALDFYRHYRLDIPRSVPFWPLGLPAFGDWAVSVGLRCENKSYIGVWRLGGDSQRIELSLPHLRGRRPAIRCAFPGPDSVITQWNSQTATLTVLLPQPGMARLLEVADTE